MEPKNKKPTSGQKKVTTARKVVNAPNPSAKMYEIRHYKASENPAVKEAVMELLS
jgi:hypothetical protein